jgi:replicative DNA helicase
MEHGLICSLILEPALLDECGRLNESVFYLPKFRILFRALKHFRDTSQPWDFPLFKKALADAGQLEEVGGLEGLSETWTFVPTAANWGDYLAHVQEYYQRRVVIQACQSLTEKMRDPHSDSDIREIVEQTLTSLTLEASRPEKSFKEIVFEAVDWIEEQAQNPGLSGILFDIAGLDQALCGVQRGDVAVVGAATSGGKTALALQAALTSAKRGKAAAVFSLEMPARQLALRMLAYESRVPLGTLRTGILKDHQYKNLNDSVSRLASLPMFFEDDFNVDVNTVVSRCRRLKAKHNIELVVVDYLQLLQSCRKEHTREREVAESSRRLKGMARELDLTVITLSQLNDEGLLRESRAIGQDSDTVLIINPPEIEGTSGQSISILKQRNGPHGQMIPVRFLGQYMRFEEGRKT